MEDWLKIKTEYITTDTSYRKLAEKYGLRYATVQSHGQEEGWPELRDQYRTKVVSKTIEKNSERQAKQAAKVNDLADKLLLKLEQAIDELDLQVTTHKIKTERANMEKTTEFRVAEPGGTVDRAGLRQLTAALKELQAIKGEVTDLERREREARIENLRRQAAQSENAGCESMVVQLEGCVDEYAQ